MSIGFTIKKVAEYSTLPFAFFGARLISLMIVLCGSLGSSSPNTRPASVSYCPALPKDAPPNAGDVFVSITILVTRASPRFVNASVLASAMHTPRRRIRALPMNVMQQWFFMFQFLLELAFNPFYGQFIKGVYTYRVPSHSMLQRNTVCLRES